MESETQLTLSKLQIHSERKYPLLSANYCTPVDIKFSNVWGIKLLDTK
jgi:hypothetical protein